MAWVDISEGVYKAVFDCAANIDADKQVYVTLQYDDASVSPVYAKVRFKLNNVDGVNYFDTFHILTEQSTSGFWYFIKSDWNIDNWPYYSTSFTITKNSGVAKFTIPSYYLINNGQTATTINSLKSAYIAATDTRKNYTCAVDSKAILISSDETLITPVNKGSISITDNYNNTFTVKGTKGAGGDNNPATGYSVSWGYTTSYENSGAVTSKALAITTPANATRTVYAKCITTATYGADAVATTSLDIKQYVMPSIPGAVSLSYSDRFTLKSPWTFSWGPASAANSSSPICGYRIRLLKNGVELPGLATSGDNIIYSAANTNTFVDRDGSSCTMSINLSDFSFVPGDTVSVMIHAYTRYGVSNAGAQLFNNTGSSSSSYTIKRASNISTNVSGTWKDGLVYANILGSWVEAQAVYTNVNGNWVESK